MLKRIKYEIRLCQILLWVLGAFITLSYSPVQAEVVGLKLSLDLSNSDVVFGEPVYVAAKLENTLSNPIAVFPSLYPEDSALQIEIIGPDGKRRSFIPYSLDSTDLAPKNLPQGESIIAAFPIFYGGRGWTFQQIGKYQISGIFVNTADGTPMVKSKPVELTVSKGDGSGQFLLKGGKATDEACKFLLWQSGDHLRTGIAHLETLIEKYQNSILTNYIRLAFAHNLSRPFRDYSIGKLRKPNPEAALKYLKKVNFDRLPQYLKVGKILTEFRSQKLLGNTNEAETLLKKAYPIVEEQPALRSLLEQAGVPRQ